MTHRDIRDASAIPVYIDDAQGKRICQEYKICM